MLHRQYIQSTQAINYPSSQLWALLSSCIHVEKWHPLVESCTLEGDLRICKTEQGILREIILVNDHENQTLKYHIQTQHVYPITSDIMCTMKVIEGKEACILTWDIEFDSTSEEKYQEMQEGFSVLTDSVKNMIESIS